MTTRLFAATLALVAVTTLAGCSGSGGGAGRSDTATGSSGTGAGTATPSVAGSSGQAPTPFPSAPAGTGRQYYVSLGDSYAVGYQGTARGRGHTTRNGFADQLVRKAKAKGYDWTLVNFGCAGATTGSMLTTPSCKADLDAPGAPVYQSPQTAAAVSFLKAHRGHIGLITVVIGGNDVLPCGVRSDAVTCLTTAVGTARTNLSSILAQLRAAAGPSTRIVGVTYPDVLLGNLLSKDPTLRSLASLSVTAFQSLINPQLQQAYQAAGARFVDVTAAFGGYGPLTQLTTLPPYGSIPVPTAQICNLTFFCEYQDIHPRTSGYAIITGLVDATLPRQ